ncbi:MAG: hypothetical protein AAGH15_23385, partial [Myxococcota bacterium]
MRGGEGPRPSGGPAPTELRRLAPHVYLQAFGSGVDARTLQDFLARVETQMPSFERPFAWVVDIHLAVRATSVHRRLFAEHDRRTVALDREHCAGVGLVVKNAVMRGMVTAVHWMQPPVYPYVVTNGRAEALEFCRTSLA